MAHLIPDDLLAQAKRSLSRRATRVLNAEITVKIGPTINQKHYEVLKSVYETQCVPCPRPMSFVELDGGYNAIIMSTIQGRQLSMSMGDDVVKSVLLEVKNGMDALQDAIETAIPRDGDTLGSIAEGGRCIKFPLITGYQDGPVSLSTFVDTMMDIYPQRADLYASMTQRAVLAALTSGSIGFRHMDLNARHILVDDGRLAGIVDWDMAGWYTEAMNLYTITYTVSSFKPDLYYSPLLLDVWGYGQSGLYALASLSNKVISDTFQAEERKEQERLREDVLKKGLLVAPPGVVTNKAREPKLKGLSSRPTDRRG